MVSIHNPLIEYVVKGNPDITSPAKLAQKLIDSGKFVLSEKENLRKMISRYIHLHKDENWERKAKDVKPKNEPIKANVSFEETKNSGILDAKGSVHIKTLDQIIEEANIDLNMWSIDKHVINKWDMTNAEGQTHQNWQVKAWLSKNIEKFDLISFKDDMFEELRNFSPKYPKIQYRTDRQKRLLEVDIFDFHYGKLCWGEETGENYDTKIAEERFMGAIQELLNYASVYKIEKIIFPIGNDYFNSDTRNNTTSNLTPQDEDLRWQKTVKKGRQLAIRGIDMLQSVAPVEVIIVQGNHDWERSFALGESLECWYNNCPNVTINNNPTTRKYFEYGSCLIGFTHGDNEKATNLPYLMSEEMKEAWTRTSYREWHMGHIHHKKEIHFKSTEEFNGTTLRYLRSLAGTDAWHAKKGYKGNIKAAEGFIWDKEDGMIAQFTASV